MVVRLYISVGSVYSSDFVIHKVTRLCRTGYAEQECYCKFTRLVFHFEMWKKIVHMHTQMYAWQQGERYAYWLQRAIVTAGGEGYTGGIQYTGCRELLLTQIQTSTTASDKTLVSCLLQGRSNLTSDIFSVLQTRWEIDGIIYTADYQQQYYTN